MLRVLLVISVLGLWSARVDAQIVNVQAAMAAPLDHDGVLGQAEGKISWREGNNPIFDIGGSGSLLVRRGDFLGLALVRGGYGTSRGLTLSKKTFEHVRIRETLDCHWKWEVFGQHEYDQFRRLSLRALVGTGPAFAIFDTKDVGMLVGAGYLYESERLDKRAGTIDAGLHATAHRVSAYVTGHEKLSTGVAIVETVYAQPRIDDPRDVRILGELSVHSKLTQRIALKDSFNIAYDRTPPDGVQRYDTSLEASVIVTF